MKRNYSTTPQLRVKRALEGRGQGRGEDYKPELTIHDVPSQGLSTRIKGWTTNRVHHLFSKLELHYFYLLDWSSIVCDIREQFPLDLDETMAIANQIGVKHPTDPRTKHSIVMTTDFLITTLRGSDTGDKARTIKYASKLSSNRVLEKFEIERLYWKNRYIDWGIVTEQEINLILIANIQWLHPYRDVAVLSPLNRSLVSRIETVLARRVSEENVSLRNITNDCDAHFGLPEGSCLMIVRHLLATKKWRVNMTEPIQVTNRLALLVFPTINK